MLSWGGLCPIVIAVAPSVSSRLLALTVAFNPSSGHVGFVVKIGTANSQSASCSIFFNHQPWPLQHAQQWAGLTLLVLLVTNKKNVYLHACTYVSHRPVM
jgi:hypothetical protein